MKFLILLISTCFAQNTIYFGALNDGTRNYYLASATADTTITSGTDTLLDSMTITPGAGIYFADYKSSFVNSSNGAVTTCSIYSGGSQVNYSPIQGTSFITGVVVGNQPNQTVSVSQAIVSPNGSQAVEVRCNRSAGTSTFHQRSLILVRIK